MVNRVLKFTWDEWKWLAVIVMLGVVMYWTAVVVEPTYTILQEAKKTQQIIEDNGKIAVEQNHLIIDNQNNNTARLESIIRQQGNIMDNQVILVSNIDNATSKLGSVVAFFRDNFNETFLRGEDLERVTTQDILGNVTQIRNLLLLKEVHVNQTLVDLLIEREMKKWIEELRSNLSSNLS